MHFGLGGVFVGQDGAVTHGIDERALVGPCAASVAVSWVLEATVEPGSLLCPPTPPLAPSGVGEDAGWSTVLHEWALDSVKGG